VTSLHWLPEAKDDIQRLHQFLHGKNVAAAARMIDTLLSGADRLLMFPEQGAPLNDKLKRRELFLPFGGGSYVLRYRLEREKNIVIRVWHSRELREV
jgi:plasmid stabilization system protein ParE